MTDVISGHMPLHPDIRITADKQFFVSEAPPMDAGVEAKSRAFMTAAQRLPTLFELEDEAYRLLVRLEQNDAVAHLVEENDAGDADIADLALIDQMLMEKTESYVSVIRNLEAMSAARKAESDRLKDRAETARKHAEWLKARLLTHLQSTGRERIETSRFTLTVRQNNPSVNVLDAAAIPSEFTRTTITVAPDKVGILAHTKATGEVVPGTEIVRTERLEVR